MIPIDKLKSAKAWLTPFDTDTVLTPDHVEAVKTLVYLAQSVIDGTIFAGEEEIEQIILNLPCGTNNGFPSAYTIAKALVGKVGKLQGILGGAL